MIIQKGGTIHSSPGIKKGTNKQSNIIVKGGTIYHQSSFEKVIAVVTGYGEKVLSITASNVNKIVGVAKTAIEKVIGAG